MKRVLFSGILLAAWCAPAADRDRFWHADWIEAAGTAPNNYGVFHFRKSFELPAKPATFMVDVSADNRYQLFVNGNRVAAGPARGDLSHWRYERVDISAQLLAGKNVLAAVVWNEGEAGAIAQATNRTGFILRAEVPENNIVDTNSSWRALEDAAYSPRVPAEEDHTGYYALGPNENFDAAKHPWNWESAAFDDSAWRQAHSISYGADREVRDAPNRWMLVPSEIPMEEQVPERLQKLRRAEGVAATDAFLAGHQPLQIPPHTMAKLLLDQTYLTTAYPELVTSGGVGASVELKYAETLFIKKEADKGNRNDIEGKSFFGPSDMYLADGGQGRIYRPLFWRTYRYLQVTVSTADAPLTLEDIRGAFTGYPFQRKARFTVPGSSSDAEVQKILTTGFRTARLCAHETYMDCPFYEQLQYAGDARIQMMVSLYNTGDSRLMKNGIALLNDSRSAEGATYSRAPSRLQQYIPPFSLWWIGMLHDYWMYVDDPGFVKQMLPGARSVLAFYARYQKPNGSLVRMPWWNFVDWVPQWKTGEPPAEEDGSSAAALDLQLALAYDWAAELEKTMGSSALAAEYTASAKQIRTFVLANDWDEARGLFADQPSHKTYSQHVNTLAIMAHLLPKEESRALLEKALGDKTLAQSTIYFRAYTNGVLREVGLGDRYLDSLGAWRDMLSQGLTTWAEWNGPDVRSDCHAWGASPNFEMLRTVAGIESAAPGFAKVHIAPNLGALRHVSASMPHPKGEIVADLRMTDRQFTADIELPAGVTGEFEWGGMYRPLVSGKNHLELRK